MFNSFGITIIIWNVAWKIKFVDQVYSLKEFAV
jgi:hypothetical protein